MQYPCLFAIGTTDVPIRIPVLRICDERSLFEHDQLNYMHQMYLEISLIALIHCKFIKQ